MNRQGFVSIEFQKRSTLIVIGIAISLAVVATSVFYYFHPFLPLTADWKIYTFPDLKVQFAYPPNYTVRPSDFRVHPGVAILSPDEVSAFDYVRKQSGNAVGYSMGVSVIPNGYDFEQALGQLSVRVPLDATSSSGNISGTFDLIQKVSMPSGAKAYLVHRTSLLVPDGYYTYYIEAKSKARLAADQTPEDRIVAFETHRRSDLSDPIFQNILNSIQFTPPPPPLPPQGSPSTLSSLPPPARPPLYPPPSKDYFQQGDQAKDTIANIIGLADPVSVGELHGKYRISPDGKYKVVLLAEDEGGGEAQQIVDIAGKKITSVHTDLGSFVAWTPDSKYAIFEGTSYLGLDDKVSNPGIPGFGTSISPIDGSAVYSDECCGTNDSELGIKRPDGSTKILIERGRYIIAWEVWSPKGDKIAFLKGDPSLSDDSIWLINPDGTGLQRISGVDWNYPPVWSADGSKIIFTYNGFIWAYDVSGKTAPSQVGGDCATSSIDTSTWKTYKKPDWEIKLSYPSEWQTSIKGGEPHISGGGYDLTISRDAGFGWDESMKYDSCDSMVSGQRVHILTSVDTSSTPIQLLSVGSKLHTYSVYVQGALPNSTINAVLESVQIGAADLPSNWIRYYSEDWNLALWHPPAWQVSESPGTAKQMQELSSIELTGDGCDVRVSRGTLEDVGRTPSFSLPFYGTDGFGFWVYGPGSCSDIVDTMIHNVPIPPLGDCIIGPTISTSSWPSYGDPQFSGPINLQYPPDWQVQDSDGYRQSITNGTSSLELWGSLTRNAPESGNYHACNLKIGDQTAMMWEENLNPHDESSPMRRRINFNSEKNGSLWMNINALQSERPIIDTILKTMVVRP